MSAAAEGQVPTGNPSEPILILPLLPMYPPLDTSITLPVANTMLCVTSL